MIRDEGSVAVVVAPIRMGSRVEGLIYCDNRSARPFTERDEEVLMRLADHAAIAVHNAGLYQQAERARQEAESANRAKDEFLAVLSHELRTPLTSMLGWLRLLRSGQLTPERSGQALEVVERNTRIQAQLINDLLDVSRIIAGKLQLDCYEVELAPIVEEAVESVAQRRRGQGRASEDRAGRRRRAGAGRSAPPGPDRVEPRHQRREVHPGRRRRVRAAGPGGCRGRPHGERHRHRDRAGHAGRRSSTASVRPTARSRGATAGWGSVWRSCVT